nr:transporter substrate-binding domain-containing protein [Rheinheimera sp.]
MFGFQWRYITLLGCCLSTPLFAADKLRFVLYYPQVPPYMYLDQHSNKVVGLVPDLLEEHFRHQQVQIEFIVDNRRGAEHRLYSGDVDAMLLAPEWTAQPQQLIFSDMVLPHRDYLFSLRPFAKGSTIQNWLPEKTVCTRQYYIYQALEPFFKAHKTTRVDASSELAQMKMLQSGRCDYAYINEHVARWMQQHQLADIQLYQSPEPFGEVALRVAFHPKWQPYLAGFNQYLVQQRQQEKITQKLKFYIDKN